MNFYEILGVTKTATGKELKSAYRKQASKLHPDKGGTAEGFAALEEAYRCLSDAVLREDYDQGHYDPAKQSLRQQAIQELGKLVSHLLQQPYLDELLSAGRNEVKRQRDICSKDSRGLQARMRVVADQRAKLKPLPNTNDLLGGMLDAQMGIAEQMLAKMLHADEVLLEVLAIFDEYEQAKRIGGNGPQRVTQFDKIMNSGFFGQ